MPLRSASAAVFGAVLLAPVPIGATGFHFELDELAATGQIAFFDDFSDGSRTAPPTGALLDGVGVTTEANGALVFTDTDGYGLVGGVTAQDGVVLAIGLSDGLGDAELEATFSVGLPMENGQAVGVGVVNAGTGPGPSNFGIAISYATAPSAGNPCGPGLIVFAQFGGFGSSFAGCDVLDPAAVTGPVRFALLLDDATNQVTGSYSLDGGASYSAMSAWDVPAPNATAFLGGTNSFWFVLAQGAAVPEPSAAILWPLPVLLALAVRRRRSGD
jgi:hypothetical protein